MKLSICKTSLKEVGEEMLAYPVFEGAKIPGELSGFFQGLREKQFSGKEGEALSATTSGKAGFSRVLLVGMGNPGEMNPDCIRRLAGTAVRAGISTKSQGIAIFLPRFENISADDAAQAASEGAVLASYKFTRFKTKKEDLYGLPKAVVVSDADESALMRGMVLAGAQNYARELEETPANLATPSSIAKEAKKLAKEHGFSCRVFGPDELKKMKMEAFLGVAKGSEEPPQMVVLEYGEGKGKPFYAIVGKGVTFDSGGLSLKPSKGMHEMKYDKSGAIVVMGVFRAAAQLRLPVRLLGVMPLTENLPSGTAQKPGDIVTACNGKTIEVLNTDAEGRLILADAMAYAGQKKPDCMLTIATLTGAVIVALGRECAGVLTEDDALAETLAGAGDRTWERVWRLPLWKEYSELMKSDFADLKNVSETGEAGTITAAAFLKEFAGDSRWAHLDIAGVDMVARPHPYLEKGASGIGVRLLCETLKSLSGQK